MTSSIDDDTLHSIIGQIYDGVTNPTTLAEVIDRIISWIGADSALLASLFQSDPESSFLLSRGIDESIVRDYAADDQVVDAWAIKIPARLNQDVVIFLGEELVPERELMETDFYRKYLNPAHVHHLLSTAMRLDANRREMDVSLSLFRPIDRPAFDEACRKAMGRIADHLRRALLLSAALKQAQLRAVTSETILEYVGSGILLVDEQSRLIHATASATEFLRRRQGLRIVNGHVSTSSAQDSQRLQELIRRAAAVNGKIPSSGSMPIRQADSPHPLVVSVFPVPYSHETFRGHSRHRVLLILNDSGQKRVKNSEVFGRYYSLTARELQLCCALAEGKDLAVACEALGIRHNTGRTHLINVFAKVGVHRQSDLVALILSFG